MFGVPFSVFYYIRTFFKEQLSPDEDLYAGLAAVVCTQLVMFIIVIFKYSSDFSAVLNGEGNVPYDASIVATQKVDEFGTYYDYSSKKTAKSKSKGNKNES